MVQNVYPELQNLYSWLELEFHPLKLSTRVASSLEFIAKKDELAQYGPALQDITVMRLLKQVLKCSFHTIILQLGPSEPHSSP